LFARIYRDKEKLSVSLCVFGAPLRLIQNTVAQVSTRQGNRYVVFQVGKKSHDVRHKGKESTLADSVSVLYDVRKHFQLR
jgi:hypothetical protein